MAKPKSKYEFGNKQFVNPYHFVPLGKMVNGAYPEFRKKPDEDRKLSGRIDYTITPLTDLFIPNTSSEKAFDDTDCNADHKLLDFFSYDDLSAEKSKDRDARILSGPLQPLVPASEIRGVIRSAYEALSDSCMSVLDEKPLTARNVKPKLPGVIKVSNSGGSINYQLYAAERVMLNTKRGGLPNWGNFYQIKIDGQGRYIEYGYTKYRSGDEVYFVRSARPYRRSLPHYVNSLDMPGGYSEKGILYLGESITRKHHQSIMVMNATPIRSLVDEEIEKLKEIITDYYQNDKINRGGGLRGSGFSELPTAGSYSPDKHHGYEEIGKLLKKKPAPGAFFYIPVWYEELNVKGGGKALYLSPSCIGRELFRNTQKSLAGYYKPCTDAQKLCRACRLFGFVEEEGVGAAQASRLRFTDARLKKGVKPDYRGCKVLRELSGPKTSATEFYTCTSRLKGPAHWNYDYFFQNGGKTLFDQGEIALSGRKFYWHHNPATVEKKAYIENNDNNKTERNATIRPLKAQMVNTRYIPQFEASVYFDHISKQELRELLFTLSLGTTNIRGAHKIGHGKPLGLGSVKILVEKVFTRELSLNGDALSYNPEKEWSDDYKGCYAGMSDAYYESNFEKRKKAAEDIAKKIAFPTASVSAVLRLTDFEAMNNQDVCYPIGEDDTAESNDPLKYSSAHWFMGNRSASQGATPMKPIFEQKLKPLSEEDQRLTSYIKKADLSQKKDPAGGKNGGGEDAQAGAQTNKKGKASGGTKPHTGAKNEYADQTPSSKQTNQLNLIELTKICKATVQKPAPKNGDYSVLLEGKFPALLPSSSLHGKTLNPGEEVTVKVDQIKGLPPVVTVKPVP